MNNESKNILAKLQTQICLHEIKVKENPIPYLQEARKQVIDISQCMEQIRCALRPLPSTMLDPDPIEQPLSIRDEAYGRIINALKIIDDYYKRY